MQLDTTRSFTREMNINANAKILTKLLIFRLIFQNINNDGLPRTMLKRLFLGNGNVFEDAGFAF